MSDFAMELPRNASVIEPKKTANPGRVALDYLVSLAEKQTLTAEDIGLVDTVADLITKLRFRTGAAEAQPSQPPTATQQKESALQRATNTLVGWAEKAAESFPKPTLTHDQMKEAYAKNQQAAREAAAVAEPTEDPHVAAVVRQLTSPITGFSFIDPETVLQTVYQYYNRYIAEHPGAPLNIGNLRQNVDAALQEWQPTLTVMNTLEPQLMQQIQTKTVTNSKLSETIAAAVDKLMADNPLSDKQRPVICARLEYLCRKELSSSEPSAYNSAGIRAKIETLDQDNVRRFASKQAIIQRLTQPDAFDFSDDAIRAAVHTHLHPDVAPMIKKSTFWDRIGRRAVEFLGMESDREEARLVKEVRQAMKAWKPVFAAGETITADCLSHMKQRPEFIGTPEQVEKTIDTYLKTHPEVQVNGEQRQKLSQRVQTVVTGESERASRQYRAGNAVAATLSADASVPDVQAAVDAYIKQNTSTLSGISSADLEEQVHKMLAVQRLSKHPQTSHRLPSPR